LAWSNLCSAAAVAQLNLGDKISVFSDKAYRKGNGRYFEAVGNVVIINQKDTIYGELASLDQNTMMVKIEGNVRFITKDMTLYGSHLEYNIALGTAVIKNARILTSTYNLVANRLVRLSAEEYMAEDGEFTTCRDCAESWSVYGKTFRLKVGRYLQIYHGLYKIKGINVLYFPYIILPIQNKRKSGLLFPDIGNRLAEGLAVAQPVFWAIDSDKDATITPTWWATRGYGTDLQYRQRFSDTDWIEVNGRGLNDRIYVPGKNAHTASGDGTFRYFTEVEGHKQWTPNFSSHARFDGVRDLDVIRDNTQYTDNKVLSSDVGLRGFLSYRHDYFHVGADGSYLRNQLFHDPMEFDRSYVQTLPRFNLSTVPFTLVQTQTPMLQYLGIGFDSSVTRFRQVQQYDDPQLRNADRFSLQPYVMWNFFTWGPVNVKTRYQLDQQFYHFSDSRERHTGKNAGMLKTEASFTMDRIFGLAYEEKIPVKYIPEKDLSKLREKKEQGLTPLKQTQKNNRLIGEMPEFTTQLASETITQIKNSFRHAQEFKFIHHYISSDSLYGSDRFISQIRSGQSGWFDYEDSIRAEEFLFGSAATRTIIPPTNTVEFQWRNSLIRKTPKSFNFFEDEKYLRDNFSYSMIGYFNVSQGYLLNAGPDVDLNHRLTRLAVDTGYSADKWSISLTENYFHDENQNIFTTTFLRRFESLNLLGSYNYNSFSSSPLSTIAAGAQVRPIDIIGVAMLKDLDMNSKNNNIRTIYSLDIMPNNDCWILSLNYRETLVDNRFYFNFLFNFGDDRFRNFKTNYFSSRQVR